MSLVSRLDKIAATIATKKSPRRQVVRQIIDGVDDQEVVLDRMV